MSVTEIKAVKAKKGMFSPAERQALLDEARVFFISAPVLLPLVERKKKAAIERLVSNHREGKTGHGPLVAEISVLESLEREIKTQNSMYSTLMEDLNGKSN